MSHEVPKKFGPNIAEHIAMKDVGEVFGYRLMGTMDEYIVKAIEIRLNQFVGGVTSGLTRFIEETAAEAAREAVEYEIKKLNKVKDNTEVVNEFTVPELPLEREVLPVTIPSDFRLPRNPHGRLDWAKCDKRGEKRILFYLMKQVELEGIDIKVGTNFKNVNSDCNGAYQRAGSIIGGWKDVVSEYQTAIFESDLQG